MAKSPNYYIYGLNTVTAVLNHSPERVLTLFTDNTRKDDRIQSVKQAARQLGLAMQNLDSRGFEKQLGDVNHQGVMALVKPALARKETELIDQLNALTTAPLLTPMNLVTMNLSIQLMELTHYQ